MEDPWANTWGESSKAPIPDSPNFVPGSSTWVAPSVSAIHGDNEDDLSTSSWSVQQASRWDDDSIEAPIWTNDASPSWVPASSTFDRISLSSTSEFPSESRVQFSATPSESLDNFSSPITFPASFVLEDGLSPTSPVVDRSDTPARTLSLPALVLDEDIDAFGTFETGEEADRSGEWTPPRSNFSIPSAEVAALAPKWDYPASAATDATHDTIKDLDEAWERARQEKENQDRYVPRELLASILDQVEAISDELWPHPESDAHRREDEPRPADIEDLSLNSVILRLAPEDLTLPPRQSFAKTSISQKLYEVLKLTRHSPLTKLSPMAFYLSSKGVTTWEASVKAKPNVTSDDFAPPGWKIVENPKAEVLPTEDAKKKSSGGLLSFFGRRSTTSSSDSPASGLSVSPVAVSDTSVVKTTSSPRASFSSIRLGGTLNDEKAQATALSPVVSAVIPTESDMEKPSNTTIVAPDSVQREVTSSSAVSRFFDRFSRHKSSASRDSLTLSADDFEFLSDMPTTEIKEEETAESVASGRMIKSYQLPTAPPAPLASPRAPHQPSQTFLMSSERKNNQEEDFFSFFDSKAAQSISKVSPTSTLASVPTPPIESMFKTSTKSNHSHPGPLPTMQTTLEKFPKRLESPPGQAWPSFDNPSTLVNKPAQPRRPVVAIMTSSSPSSSASIPPLLPKPSTSVSLQPAPSSSSSRAPSPSSGFPTVSSSNISSLPPLPSSRSHTPSMPAHHTLFQTPSADIRDDDDFADFLSSPALPTGPALVDFADFESPKGILLSQTRAISSKDVFNSFEDFEGPPRPPAKPTDSALNSHGLPSPPSKPPNVLPALGKATRKSSSAAEHSRTLSLLESAAARGRWLGPPSPLPEALPPPSTSTGKSSSMNPFEGGSRMQAQQARATAALSARSTSVLTSHDLDGRPQTWDFPSMTNPIALEPIRSPPPSKSQTILSSFAPNHSSISPAPNVARSGVLSAQDISFFEGI